MTNKRKAKAYYTAVNAYDEATIEYMIHENYIQHNLKVPTGRAAFVAMLPKLKEHGSKIENIRILEDGSHIIMHHKWKNATPLGCNEAVAFHIIRFDTFGIITEHWNVMTETTPLNPSKRSLFDGETKIKDKEKTAANKSTITALFNQLISKNIDKTIASIPQFFKANFQQHHPQLVDGIPSLIKAIQDGVFFPHYKEQHAVFGEGNFVLSISEGIYAGKKSALYDLFQMENGQIAAHWNIYQEIPTQDLANNNTMFNFQKTTKKNTQKSTVV